uniref:KNTC1 third ARM-repeats domain-containing protein n=1 Tax=Odontella aurita TaxID=265563 RepID=A0A7S4NG27_9STRA
MASVRELLLPRPGDGASRRSRGRTGSDAGGWDDNVGERRFDFGANESLHSASIARHAVACGCSVLGTTPPGRRKGESSADSHWIKWESSFEPYQVQKVASTSDGSVIAVSTTGGTVSLLRGADGAVMATRRVSSEEDAPVNEPIEVTFVSHTDRYDSFVSKKEVLLIVAPLCEQGVDEDVGRESEALDEGHVLPANVLMVSGIDGARLNGDDQSSVARAARNMAIDTLNLELPFGYGGHTVSLNGCFLDEHTIRFLAADSHGNISVHDYDIQSKESSAVKTDAFSDLCVGGKLTFNRKLGFKLDTETNHGPFCLVPSCTGNGSKISWYDVVKLKLVCEHTVPSGTRNERFSMIAMESIRGCDDEATVAVAVVFRSVSNEAFIQVVQAIVSQETDATCTISQPSVVYRVPVAGSDNSQKPPLSISISATFRRPFCFRYITCDMKSSKCKEFESSEGDIAGKFRVLLTKGLFDEADELLTSFSPRSFSSSSEFASIHSSEVALSRFRYMLASGNITKEVMSRAKECLRRLAAGAVSGGDIGFRCLLEASESILMWPTSAFAMSDDINDPLRISSYRMALLGMSATMAGAAKAVPPTRMSALQEEKSKLDAKSSAMQCIEGIILAESNEQVCLSSPLNDVSSVPHLFKTLVAHGSLAVAERVRRSEFGRVVTPEIMASSVIEISATVDPRSYCNWLKEMILPGLSMDHPLLTAIRSWSCQVADDFDDSDDASLGIDASIMLLKTIAEGTARLSTRMHSSFASDSPFRDDKFWNSLGDVPESLDSPSLESPRSIDSSFSSLGFLSPGNAAGRYPLAQVSSIKSSNPTIMKLGLLRSATAKQCSGSLLSRRAGALRSGILPRLSSKSSTVRISIDSEAACEEDGCVEAKLFEAERLQEARALGLPKDIVSLRAYDKVGGPFIAKELIRAISNFGSEERDRRLLSEIKPFCESAHVDFDEAVAEYTKDRCDNNKNDPQTLREAAHLSRLCSSPTNCYVALKVLRTALLCSNPPMTIFQLSQEALEWATDDRIKSELEESSRLLVIDGIVRRYIGNGAREFFRVSDARHGLRLLQHVCRHVDESTVISDALALCDGFTHLSRLEACVQILQRVILAPEKEVSPTAPKQSSRAEQCASMFQSLYSVDAAMAESAGLRLVMFCVDTIDESANHLMKYRSSSEIHKRKALAASSAAVSLLSLLQERCSMHNVTSSDDRSYFVKVGSSSWSSLLAEIQRIHQLQTDFDTFLSLSCLRKGTRNDQVAESFLCPVLVRLEEEELSIIDLRSALSHARRGCRLLWGEDSTRKNSHWWSAVGRAASSVALNAEDDSACMDLIEASGMLDDSVTATAFNALISVALALCARASEEGIHLSADAGGTQPRTEAVLVAMRSIVRANSLLEHVLTSCRDELLSRVLSLSTLTDIVNQVLVRTDSGVGETMDAFRRQLNELARKRRDPLGHDGIVTKSQDGDLSKLKVPPTPTLHSSWYIGDGLLLPPTEALLLSLEYCKMARGSSGQDEQFFSFLDSRGAYSLALRMLNFSSANSLTANMSEDRELSSSFSSSVSSGMSRAALLQDNIRCLAERSLGGSGNGLTSGTIDSQLAVAYILSLPLKLAFKVYKACLPSAMTRRDFGRVVTIANIGVRCGICISPSQSKAGSWSNQQMFVSQCQRLSANAKWWHSLQNHGVTFDPRLFEEGDMQSRGSGKPKLSLEYVASLVPLLIHGSSMCLVKRGGHLNQVLDIITKYVRAFGLDPRLAPQKFVEFLLANPSSEKGDIRQDLVTCTNAAKHSLLLLPSPIARSAVLRRCLVSLEAAENCNKDYERFSTVLSLYRNELANVITQTTKERIDITSFRSEIDKVERRQEALAVLSSFFRGDAVEQRPPFPDLFTPLPRRFKSNKEMPTKRPCGILGPQRSETDLCEFDPLYPLKDCLSADSGTSTATALSPLCVSLGLPPGYIHARSLYERFVKAKKNKSSLPSFESTRFAVSKVHGARDGAQLAEWCAMQYADGTKERLKSLALALSFAMKASSDAEKRRLHNKDDSKLAKDERRALDVVKRISDAKAALSDRMRVQLVLSRQSKGSPQTSQVDAILSVLVDQVHSKHSGEGSISPDDFVDGLLCEGSLMVAESSLDESTYFGTECIRQVAAAVHRACKALSEQYSHVHAGKRARALARRWLVHGDDFSSSGISEIVQKADGHSEGQQLIGDADEDDTANFVLDLNSLGGQEVWSDDVGAGKKMPNITSSVTSEEEPTALIANVSAREKSEHTTARVGIRIAFVMSFADEYKKTTSAKTNGEADENADANRRPLRSKLSSKSSRVRSAGNPVPSESDAVMNHAKELLSIVFARSGSHLTELQSLMSSRQTEHTPLSTKSRHSNATSQVRSSTSLSKTHTFAMRHRALRAASILCPQEALEAVIKEEGYLGNVGSDVSCTLRKCSFGSFLAKEIEEMGLPLPHSCLVQLSTMHFSSYARALWRHHGRSECRGYKGRLLLLLLELCFKDGTISDPTLVIAILDELSPLELPRTMLRSCEFISELDCIDPLLTDSGRSLARCMKKTAQLILSEMQRNLSNELDMNQSLLTLERLGAVVAGLDSLGLGGQLPSFVQIMCQLATTCADIECLSQGILQVALSAACSLEDAEKRRNAFLSISKVSGGKGKEILRRIYVAKSTEDCLVDSSSTTAAIQRIEQAFGADVAAALDT